MSDLIDRKEAVEAVKNEMLSWLEGDSHDYRKVVDAIMDSPTVDAVPVRHGKWVYHYRLKKFVCLECGYEQKHKPEWKYCPNCGAKMEERKEE